MRHPLAAKPIPNEHHQTGTAGANPFQYRFPTFYPPPELTSTTREYPVRIYIYIYIYMGAFFVFQLFLLPHHHDSHRFFTQPALARMRCSRRSLPNQARSSGIGDSPRPPSSLGYDRRVQCET